MTADADLAFMRDALALARAQLGRTAPNPSVGCVIVSNGVITGRGATADGGRPHAERVALDQAGDKARGADVFVTLEPCAHHGVTPPCAEALVEADVARVVIACSDPDPRVSGAGEAILRKAGIRVEAGLERDAAEALNAGFFKRLSTGLPLLALTENGDSYDAVFDAEPDADLHAALADLGRKGANRVWTSPGTPLAEALEKAGLVDVKASPSGTRR